MLDTSGVSWYCKIHKIWFLQNVLCAHLMQWQTIYNYEFSLSARAFWTKQHFFIQEGFHTVHGNVNCNWKLLSVGLLVKLTVKANLKIRWQYDLLVLLIMCVWFVYAPTYLFVDMQGFVSRWRWRMIIMESLNTHIMTGKGRISAQCVINGLQQNAVWKITARNTLETTCIPVLSVRDVSHLGPVCILTWIFIHINTSAQNVANVVKAVGT